MKRLALIRHGPTDWNEARLIQGHTDRPLSEDGQKVVANWRLPSTLVGLDWYVSPLTRARQTATLLGLEPAVEPLLIEMDWGEWEGKNSADLRAAYGEEFTRQTSRGLDMRPHGGETPRELRARLSGWIETMREGDQDFGAVCHQGVIRAALSLATGWDMIAKPPVKLAWAAAQVFAIDADGGVRLDEANVMLDGSDAP